MSTYQTKALQPNVGFILKQTTGYRRVLEIEFDTAVVIDDFELGMLKGELELTRTSEGVWVDGELQVETLVTCARCLTEFTQSLQLHLQELFYYPASRAQSRADYVILETGTLDLLEPIREQLLLDIPIQSLCRLDCKGLCIHCGQQLNLGDCNCKEEIIDPRFAKLQALKDQLSKE